MTDQPFTLEDDLIRQAFEQYDAEPKPPSRQVQDAEREKCAADPAYFIDTYCQIYDNATAAWIPFKLWSVQRRMIEAVHHHKLTIALKTRQIGGTWLYGDCYPLWTAIFRPIASILIWSRTDEDAVELLKRLKGTFERLPDWLKPEIKDDNEHAFGFTSGSIIRALPTTRGDGFTATYAFIDESDLDPNLDIRLQRSKPTIDAAECKLVLLSRADKANPNSTFKRIYRDAAQQANAYFPVFIPWYEHPDRTRQWYDAECRTSLSTHGSLDDIASNYPTTDVEALAARSLDKRIAPSWIAQVFRERQPLSPRPDTPALPNFRIFAYPEDNHRYGLGLDPAGGLSDGDDSALCVVDELTQEQVAVMGGKVEPTMFARYAYQVAVYYFDAPILFELNNHGYAVLAELKNLGAILRNGVQRDGTSGKPGWFTTERSKGMLYDVGAMVIQAALTTAEETGLPVEPLIYDFLTSTQLASIEISSLRAPDGDHDDYAVAWVLSQKCVYRGQVSMFVQRHDLYEQSRLRPNAKLDALQAMAARPHGLLRPASPHGFPMPPGPSPFNGPPTRPDEIAAKLRERGIKLRR